MKVVDAIREILNEVGQSVLRDPRRFRALMQDRCYSGPKGEIHITCVLLSENHVDRLRVNSLATAERERIQGLLYESFGFDREIVSRAINNWVSVLGNTAPAQLDLDSAGPEKIAEDAVSLNAQGAHGEAESLLRQSISLNPSSALLHATLAQVLAVQERLRDAVASIKKARELEPDNVDYLVYEGKLSLQYRDNRKSNLL